MGFRLEQTHKKNAISKEQRSKFESLLQKEISLFGKRFSNKKKEYFYAELSVLLTAGITLKDALVLITEGQKKKKDQEFYTSMILDLVSGKSFSETVRSKNEFNPYEFHSIQIGEQTGTLARITKELGSFYARKNEQRRILINALTYPVIIVITAILVVIFMLQMVVPMFQDIFEQQKVSLPAITKLIITGSEFIRAYGWWCLAGIGVLLILRKIYGNQPWFKRRRDLIVLKLPYFGKFVKAVYLAQFTQAVTLLTTSKVPILNSIELVKNMIDFYPLKTSLEKVEQAIMRGAMLSSSLSESSFFDSRMISMTKVAEETNKTEYIFEKLNEQYTIEVQQKSKLLATMLEPIIIVFVGILVGVILVAMYLPMFKLSNVLS